MLYLLVILGGMFGGMARLLVSRTVQRFGGDFPLGTLWVNWSGSFLVGLASALLAHAALSAPLAALLLNGVLGAYTTFSTFSYETLRLLSDGRLGAALSNALVSAGGAVLLVWLGSVAA